VPLTPHSNVLLVEDDLVFQNTFVRVFDLMAGDWKIQAFQQGSSALQVLAKPDSHFDLALIDIGLPDISGIEVIAAESSVIKE
jgi:CheY-like chemotaxis protein